MVKCEHISPGRLRRKECSMASEYAVCEPLEHLVAVQIQRSGDDIAAVLDYDIQKEKVTLTASQPLR